MRHTATITGVVLLCAATLPGQVTMTSNYLALSGEGASHNVVGASSGALYGLSVFDDGSGDRPMLLQASTDGGLTWASDPFTFNDASFGLTGPAGNQPTNGCCAAIDSNGTLHAEWGRYFPSFFRFTLTVFSCGVINSRTVSWKTPNLPTTDVNSGVLHPPVTANLVEVPVSASVTDFTPSRDAGTSSALSFGIGPNQVSTTFVSNSGQAGNMFDVVAVNPVVLEDFDLNLNPGTWDLRIYVVRGGGTWVGKQTNAAAWDLLFTGSATSAGPDTPTHITTNLGFYLPAGATQGIYITAANGLGMRYTIGSSVGAVAGSDSNLSVRVGCGKVFPFGSTFQPRIWNGAVYYSSATSLHADFDATPTSGPAPLTVAFSDESLSSSPSGVFSWDWDFDNDGITDSTIQHPIHSYLNPGVYSVRLIVTDALTSSVRIKTNLIAVGPELLLVYQTAPGDLTIDGPPDPPGTTEGYLLLSSTLPMPVGSGAFLGLQPDSLTISLLTCCPAQPCDFLHYLPTPFCFPNVPFSFPPGTFSAFAGITFDFLLIQILGGTTFVASNVARLTFL